jgi:hypothetical protein
MTDSALVRFDLTGTQMTETESNKIQRTLNPEDSYDPQGRYWADLSFRERFSFVSSINRKESKRERTVIWNSFKKDPLSPALWWVHNCIIPGAGIGLEGYTFFDHPLTL